MKILWKDILSEEDGVPILRLCTNTFDLELPGDELFLAICTDRRTLEYVLIPFNTKKAYALWNGTAELNDILSLHTRIYYAVQGSVRAKRKRKPVVLNDVDTKALLHSEVLRTFFEIKMFSLHGDCINKKEAIHDAACIWGENQNILASEFMHRKFCPNTILQIDCSSAKNLSVQYLMPLLRNLQRYFAGIEFVNVPKDFLMCVNLVKARLRWENTAAM